MSNSQRTTAKISDDYVQMSIIRPSPFDLGVTYEGAIIEGSFHISPAREVYKVHIDTPDGLEVLELTPTWTGNYELIWRFQMRTDTPMKFLAFVELSTDYGQASTHFDLEIKSGIPPGGRVLFCQSPFDASSSFETHSNLKLVARELEIQLNATNNLPEDLKAFQVIVLLGAGLRILAEGASNKLNRFLEDGGRVILLGNHFYGNSVSHVNIFANPHGIQMVDREYGEVLCDRSHIEENHATTAIRRLRWFRPSPINVKSSGRILVRNPDCPTEGFVACGGPHHNLYVIGASMIHSLVCEGWPFDNGQLFANLLKNNEASSKH